MTSVRSLVIVLLIAAAGINGYAALAPAQAPPAASPAPDRVQQLERELATAKADVLARDIALSTCRASFADVSAKLATVELSDRATRLIEDFKKAFGGDWVWSATENRPVRPTSK